MVKVGICVPSLGTWRYEFGKSLVSLCSYFVQTGNAKDSYILLTTQGSMLVQSRHQLVMSALRENCTHVLFLDCDMVFPKDILNKLLKHDKDIVAGNCTTRKMPPEPVAHDLNGDRISSKGKHGLEEVQQVGVAVMLIKVEVLKKLTPPIFMMDWVPEYKAYCGEDVYFCQLAKHVAGARVYIDHDVSQAIGHVGNYIYTYDDVKEEEMV